MKVLPTDEESRLARFKDACRRAGVKVTHQRLEIFREVISRDDHPDAAAVLLGVQKRVPTVSMDTVYRTLSMLTETGVVVTLGPRHESVRFDANPTPHHHYVCKGCGAIRDFTSPDLCALALPACVGSFGSVEATHVEVRGLCSACAARGTKPTEDGGEGEP